MKEIEYNSRRNFLKKFIGITAIVGTASIVTTLESCQKSNNTYSVNSSDCNGCQKCLSACGVGAISVSNNKASISSSKCVGCGRCAKVCSQGAIS